MRYYLLRSQWCPYEAPNLCQSLLHLFLHHTFHVVDLTSNFIFLKFILLRITSFTFSKCLLHLKKSFTCKKTSFTFLKCLSHFLREKLAQDKIANAILLIITRRVAVETLGCCDNTLCSERTLNLNENIIGHYFFRIICFLMPN